MVKKSSLGRLQVTKLGWFPESLHNRVQKVNLEIPTPNSKGNSMARCWKMYEYDSTLLQYVLIAYEEIH